MKRVFRFVSSLFVLTMLSAHSTFAQEESVVDFSAQMTPVCEIARLRADPPEGWINVPIDTGIEQMAGCQMMLIVDEALFGILRVLSFDFSTAPPDLPPWPQHIMTIETVLIGEMGYKVIEPIWRRESVPINGQGFKNAQAMGFSVQIEGNDIAQEAHMLVFENETHKYLVSLMTPAKSVDNGEYYERNTSGMAAVMQSFKIQK
jgi:hypothetical protein